MEIDHKEKVRYEAFNPINWKKKQSVLFATFPWSLMQKVQMSQQMKWVILTFISDMSISFWETYTQKKS